MQTCFVNINGEICSPEEARISIFDRSYLFGDSLYEVIRTYNGKLFQMPEHLDRIKRSARFASMELHQDSALFESEIRKTIDHLHSELGDPTTEVYCRLIISRGVGKIGFQREAIESESQYVIVVFPLPQFSDEELEKGLHLKTSDRIRNHKNALDPAMKSGNYLNCLLACLEAQDDGFDDALLCDGQGFITEGTTFNVFYVKNGILVTPPFDIGILDGITRASFLDRARELGIPIREVRFPVERLYEADEVFISSTVKGAYPVTRLDGRKIGKGKRGPITLKLHQATEKWGREAVAQS